MARRPLLAASLLALLSLPGLPGQAGGQRLAPTAGLQGSYYADAHFEHLAATRTDPALAFDWATYGPGLQLPAAFSVRWTGWLRPPVTGRYVFTLAAGQGLRVWLGGRPLADAGPAARYLTAGRAYALRAEYTTAGNGRQPALRWTPPPAGPAAGVPGARYFTTALPPGATPCKPATPPDNRGGTIGLGLLPDGTATSSPARPPVPVVLSQGTAVAGVLPPGQGLQASYYAGAPAGSARLQRVEPEIAVAWRGQPPAPGVPAQGFAVRWTGYLRAPESGVYVLHTEFDDATDVTIAGANVLAMTSYDPEFWRAENSFVPLDVVQRFEAGKFYRLDIAYKNVQGVSRAVFSWLTPAQLGYPSHIEQAFAAARGRHLAVVPTAVLYPELPRPVPAVPVAALPAAPARRAPMPLAARPALRSAAARPGRSTAAASAPPAPATAVPAALPDLATLRRGTAVPLPNVYFTQSTADLLPASYPALRALAQELRQHPTLRLELAGHTDNVGDAALNLRLSQQRARVVRRYLVQQGIDSLRLSARGYGGTRPVADNRDVQQRPRNRRVEAVVQ